MILYRPVGLTEMRLIYESGLRAFPPRLPEQPIFYPVLNAEYATQIARDWNTKARSLAGYVTRFPVEDAYAAQFEPHIVGSRIHEELWVPAERLGEFNEQITGIITVVAACFGPGFRGYIPERFGMRGRDADAQFAMLDALMDEYPMDFHGEIRSNNVAVFLHYAYWAQRDFSRLAIDSGRQDRILAAIRDRWAQSFPSLPLPTANVVEPRRPGDGDEGTGGGTAPHCEG